jgi:uncharacterized iron-regulated protein
MRIILILLAMSFLIPHLSATSRFVDTNTLQILLADKLAQKLESFDVIFFGEKHGIKQIHQAEAELSAAMIQRVPDLALSFEMWERDTQEYLNRFLAQEMSEADFLESSRAWSNFEDYRPMLNMAKEHKLHAIAANIPREYAARVSREGWDFVQELPSAERALIAQKLSAPDDLYKEQFIQVMRDMSGHVMQPDEMQNFYKAQCIKDDTMAESIANYLLENPEGKVIHFNGDFHSKSHLGTVSRLKDLMPQLKIAVISILSVKDLQNPDLPEDPGALGDFLLLVESSQMGESE